ncbi:MAG: hypothetical protein JST62_03005 [Bacteroidetes bacterium]|nr:hypothetical protein [Bacteroidota bacterium]
MKTQLFTLAKVFEILEKNLNDFKPMIKIPSDFANAMVAQLRDFKTTYPSPEILDCYEFQPDAQMEFYNQIKNSKSKIVTLHLGIVPSDFQDDAARKPHLQYFFEFDENGKYFVLLKTQKPMSVTPKDFKIYTSEYEKSKLYENLNLYISNKTGGILTENTKKIIINDISQKKNEMYNWIENQTQLGNTLKTIYCYPMMQVLDYFADEELQFVIQSIEQLYSFGILMSTEADLESTGAIIDDRHYHCPPNC